MKIAGVISKGRDELGDISTYGRIILRFTLVKYSGRVQTDFKWLKKGVSDGLLWTQPSFQVSWQAGNGFTSWGIKSFSRSIRICGNDETAHI